MSDVSSDIFIAAFIRALRLLFKCLVRDHQRPIYPTHRLRESNLQHHTALLCLQLQLTHVHCFQQQHVTNVTGGQDRSRTSRPLRCFCRPEQARKVCCCPVRDSYDAEICSRQ